jgi:hypothetical protein
MRDLGTAIEQRPCPRLRRDAGKHRVAIDHQVVVDVVEKQIVGEQDPQALEQIAAFDVAGDHRHLDPARTGASRSRRAIGESGNIASMPGTRCALVRLCAISSTTRLKAE